MTFTNPIFAIIAGAVTVLIMCVVGNLAFAAIGFPDQDSLRKLLDLNQSWPELLVVGVILGLSSMYVGKN